MSDKELEEALLYQKIEFLEAELQESKNREENLKSHNRSLISSFHSSDSSVVKDQTISDQQQVITNLKKELKGLKKRQREYEDQVKTLTFTIKELQLELKIAKDSSRQELQSLETSKAYKIQSLELTIKRLEDEREWTLTSCKQSCEHKINEANSTALKYEHEIEQLKKEHEENIRKLQAIFSDENERLRERLNEYQSKRKENDIDYIAQLHHKLAEEASQQNDRNLEVLHKHLIVSKTRSESTKIENRHSKSNSVHHRALIKGEINELFGKLMNPYRLELSELNK